MNKTIACMLMVCCLGFSCVSTPPPSPGEMSTIQKARKDLAEGYYEWTLYDMENYLQVHPNGTLSVEAHILAGDAAKGQVDRARREKKIVGMFLTTYTAPLVGKAYENYIAAADKARQAEMAAEALYKAGVILDIDYMRDFEGALVVYGEVVRKYGGSVWATKAKIRYDNLDDKFKKMHSSPHGTTIRE